MEGRLGGEGKRGRGGRMVQEEEELRRGRALKNDTGRGRGKGEEILLWNGKRKRK